MAELLVVVQETANRRMVPGDVVTVQPDGWKWGRAEAGPDAHAMWTVVRAPGVPVHALTRLLLTVVVNGREYLFRRTHLNLLGLPATPTLADLDRCMSDKPINPLLT